MEVFACSLRARRRGRNTYFCISTSYIAILGMSVRLVFKRVILQQRKHKACFSVRIEIITGEKVNLSFYASVSLKNYVLTENNFNQYVAIASLLTANSWDFIILAVQYLLRFFQHGKLDFLV